MQLIPYGDLSPSLLTELKRLLAYAVGKPDEQRLSRLLGETYSQPSRRLLALTDGSQIVGVVGFERTGESSAILMHIAVAPPYRRKGLGRRLVEHLTAAEGFARLEAETDDDAAEFYRQCRFEVVCLGEKYPGVVRYHCTWSK